MNNPFYANKAKREELSNISEKVFGTRSKWSWFVRERGYTIESIETQMRTILTELEKKETTENAIQRKGLPRQTQRPSRKLLRKLQRAQAKLQRSAQARQRQTTVSEPCDDTTGGNE